IRRCASNPIEATAGWGHRRHVRGGRGMTVRLVAFCGSMLLACAAAQPQESPSADGERVVGAADALLDTLAEGPGGAERSLGYDRRARLVLDFDDPAKLQWAYWPTQRVGLPLQLMSAGQRMLVHDLLLSVLSSKGHGKVAQIMQL